MQLARFKCHWQISPPTKKHIDDSPGLKLTAGWVSSVERCHKSPSRIGMPLNCWSADMEYAMRPGPHRRTGAHFSWTIPTLQRGISTWSTKNYPDFQWITVGQLGFEPFYQQDVVCICFLNSTSSKISSNIKPTYTATNLLTNKITN